MSSSLAALLAPHAPNDGPNPLPWPRLAVLRATRPRPPQPVLYEPSLFLVAQGCKRVHLGSERYTYDPEHYLVLSVPLPVQGEIVEASEERPFLALSLRIDLVVLTDLLLETGMQAGAKLRQPPRRGIFASRLEPELASAAERLIRAVADPVGRSVLAPLAEREVLYRLLTGAQGSLLGSFALRDGRTHRIANVLRYLQTHFEERLSIADIAREAGLSPSALHHEFRAVTSVSPLRYLKSLRLHHALRLMLQEGLGAAEAAFRVGYASPSQFSREFKRLFGQPPVEEVLRWRQAAGSPPSSTLEA